ncbi:hypothetical protein NEOLEDRAFT_1140852 [Neolentinus lepideus HHB14362 ss-1]|uniref:CrcB-like protein n=1 Tax=Neolentinus lepideus HHB14362 ss-1 TaxID=1314782 RepID=A0A165P1H0_9AGAM|nr:hypothetical protein NEOLEDRAFT_1140852 [Neolentinus lepideus HHB14362 ss-1]
MSEEKGASTLLPLHSSSPNAGDARNDFPPSSTQKTSVEGSRLSSNQAGSNVGSAIARHNSIESAEHLQVDRPPAEASLQRSKVYYPLSPHVLALLMPASVLGVLARLGLDALSTYNGQKIFSLAYTQAVGCFIMGFSLEFKESLGRFYGPLYTAITTGFCGSLTTFSGWQVDVFNSWVNSTQAHRDWRGDVMDGITTTVYTFIISLTSVWFGTHLASLLRPFVPVLRPPSAAVRYTLTSLSVCVYAATFPVYFRLPADYRHQATAALLFSYPGTLTRYILSISLNPRLSLFPLGTYVANSFGTALLGALHVIQGMSPSASPNACALLQGLADGYCGCLTTVSTFATEIDALVEWKAWLYAALSWSTGQIVLLLIMGSSFWAGHVSEQLSCRFV